MGKITFSILFVACLVFLSSCGILGFYNDGGILNRGVRTSYGQYVPKKPNYKLKDRKNHVFIENLDTVNVYRYRFYFEHQPQYEFIHYIKFYPAGRCLSFSISAKDEFGFDNRLRETDLFPEHHAARKGYYHSKDGKNVVVETFSEQCGTEAFIFGNYCWDRYSVSSSGDTLVRTSSKRVYVKEIIPETWKKYPVDW
jgi:hypothetical protein